MDLTAFLQAEEFSDIERIANYRVYLSMSNNVATFRGRVLSQTELIQTMWSMYAQLMIVIPGKGDVFLKEWDSTDKRIWNKSSSTFIETNRSFFTACVTIIRTRDDTSLKALCERHEAELLLEKCQADLPFPYSLSARTRQTLHMLDPKRHPCMLHGNWKQICRKLKDETKHEIPVQPCNCKKPSGSVPDIVGNWRSRCFDMSFEFENMGWVGSIFQKRPEDCKLDLTLNILHPRVHETLNQFRVSTASLVFDQYQKLAASDVGSVWIKNECLCRAITYAIAIKMATSSVPDIESLRRSLTENIDHIVASGGKIELWGSVSFSGLCKRCGS